MVVLDDDDVGVDRHHYSYSYSSYSSHIDDNSHVDDHRVCDNRVSPDEFYVDYSHH